MVSNESKDACSFFIFLSALAVLHVASVWNRNLRVFAIIALCYFATTATAVGTRVYGVLRLGGEP